MLWMKRGDNRILFGLLCQGKALRKHIPLSCSLPASNWKHAPPLGWLGAAVKFTVRYRIMAEQEQSIQKGQLVVRMHAA